MQQRKMRKRPRLRNTQVSRLVMAALVAAFVVSWVVTSAAQADVQYRIAWTGIGIYPRSGPSMDSAKVGAALPDGATVSIACELEGQAVSNGYNISTVWERLSDGSHLPNAFMDTAVDGWTPGVPRCDAPPPVSAQPNESPWNFAGTPIHAGQWLSYMLWDHYLWGRGARAVIAWSYLADDPALVSWMRRLPADGIGQVYTSTPWTDGDIYYALGQFSVARTSDHCYVIKDQYDFHGDKPENWPYFVYDAYQLSGARVFEVRASGCLT